MLSKNTSVSKHCYRPIITDWDSSGSAAYRHLSVPIHDEHDAILDLASNKIPYFQMSRQAPRSMLQGKHLCYATQDICRNKYRLLQRSNPGYYARNLNRKTAQFYGAKIAYLQDKKI